MLWCSVSAEEGVLYINTKLEGGFQKAKSNSRVIHWYLNATMRTNVRMASEIGAVSTQNCRWVSEVFRMSFKFIPTHHLKTVLTTKEGRKLPKYCIYVST